MFGLGEISRRIVSHGGKVRDRRIKDVRDAQRLQAVGQIQVRCRVELRQSEVDDEVFALRALTVAEKEVHRRLVSQQFLRRNALVRQQEPHGAAALQPFGDRGEAVAPVIGVRPALTHEVTGRIAAVGVEGIRRGVGFGELAVPLGPEIDGGRKREDRFLIHRQAGGLLLQKPAGLLVDPVLKRLVKSGGAHFTPEGRGVIILCQCVHGFLLEADFVAEPQGVGQNTGHRAVVTVVGVPDSGGLGPEGVYIAAAQHGEDLLPALAVRHLRQHGEGHVEVDGGADLVLSAVAGEKLGNGGAEVAVQHVRIALRLIRLLSAVCLPCVINLIETVTVKVSVGPAEPGLVRVRRHLGILRGGQLVLAEGFYLGLRAGGQGNQADRGKEKSEDPFHEKHLHLKK